LFLILNRSPSLTLAPANEPINNKICFISTDFFPIVEIFQEMVEDSTLETFDFRHLDFNTIISICCFAP
jgi:hypothetical protein